MTTVLVTYFWKDYNLYFNVFRERSDITFCDIDKFEFLHINIIYQTTGRTMIKYLIVRGKADSQGEAIDFGHSYLRVYVLIKLSHILQIHNRVYSDRYKVTLISG